MERFVSSTADAFGLGSPDQIEVAPMQGSANRLWRFDAPGGTFVVKELSHDTAEDLGRRRRAASFELAVLAAGELVMPAPVVAEDGELVLWLHGSRGEECGIRVHRWLDGSQILDVTMATAQQAGACLAVFNVSDPSGLPNPRAV